MDRADVVPDDLLAAIAARADEIEAARRLPADLARQLADAGLFRLLLPAAYGGQEAHPIRMLDTIEAVARADGATGWCLMIGMTSALTAAYMPAATAREIYGANPRVITGGVFAPLGRAVPADGGYRVDGRWQWASGCQNCDWLMGGCVILEDGKSRMLSNGMPDSRMMFFPANEVTIHDTWEASGLCGTGSHDIEVADRCVPSDRSVSIITDRPVEAGPLYAFPVFGLLALGIAGVALGIAGGAVQDLVELAAKKRPQASRRILAERASVQADVARAMALLRSARAFLGEAIDAAWTAAAAGGAVPLAQRADLRLAATNATRGAADAVDLMYDAAGGSAVFRRSPLQRRFRDVHVATQHMMVAPATLSQIGRLRLGLETDTATL